MPISVRLFWAVQLDPEPAERSADVSHMLPRHMWPSAVRHGELLGMNGALTAAIGVAGTLLGSLITYLFQGRTAKRAEAFARNERLRQEQLTACSAYAGSLTELKQGLIRVWLHREDPDGAAWKAAFADSDRLGANAEAARFRVQLVSGDSQLITLADSAFDAVGPIKTASNKEKLEEAEESFATTLKEFVAAAGARLRAAG